ncbi:hypothetical protein HDV00_008358 [Rhizophlyctis rosea]|nr:hypothetical protein HDV00_008358 [Rhizophlyctis rosea]
MDRAAKEGRVAELEWWRTSCIPLKWTENALDEACWSGNLNILQWWGQSGLDLRYSIDSIDYASLHGRIDILDCGKTKAKSNFYILPTPCPGPATVISWRCLNGGNAPGYQ